MRVIQRSAAASQRQQMNHTRPARRRHHRLSAGLLAGFCALSFSLLPAMQAHVAAASGLPWNLSITSGPTALSRPAVAVGPDGNIYVFGGTLGDNTDYNTTFIYQPSTNTWSLGASMPVAREGARAVTLPDGRIAVLGGATQCAFNELCSNGTVYNRVDVYTPATNSWGTLAPMLSPRYRFAAALYNGQIYAIGGSDGTGPVASVEAYDPSSDTWNDVASLPQPEEAPAAAVDSGNHLVVFGGFDGVSYYPTYYDSVFQYDGSTWTNATSMLQATEDSGATLGPDGQVYVIGGFNEYWLTTVQAYSAGSNGWSPITSLPSPTCCSGAVTLPNGQLYVVDGGVSAGSQVAVYGPSISLAPPAGPAGATSSLIGTDFAPSSNVSVYWGTAASGQLLGAGTADQYGTVTAPISFTVPTTATPGTYTITAMDDQSQYPVTTTFVVAGTQAALPAVSATSGSYQQRVSATGVNFKPGELISLYWDKPFTHPLGGTFGNARGNFQTSFSVPATPAGTHYLIAWGWKSHHWAITRFTVRPRTLLSQATASAGASDVLHGFGFGANAPVNVYWNSAGQGGTLLGTATADVQGTVALTFTTPLNSPGTYNIISMGQSNGGISTLTLTP